MSKQTINIGASPNDGTGTPLRTSFDYCNLNFTELYTALGGGVGLPGATTQVIFNDGGTNLAGDAGLVFDKTTDKLTIAGNVQAASATITGNLTVDTSTLFVNSSNHRVGIGTVTPLSNLHVGSGTGLNNLGVGLSRGATTNFYEAFDGTKSFLAGTDSSQAGVKVGSLTNHPLYLVSNNTSQLEITHPGIFVFNDGAGGTRMTLNSTGLGVGQSAIGAKVDAKDASSVIGFRYIETTTGNLNRVQLGAGAGFGYIDATASAGSPTLQLRTAGNTAATIDSSGSFSVGATSALNSVRIFGERADGSVAGFNRTNSNGTNILFYRQGLIVGDISVTTLATTYNSISDYRLKEAVQPLSGGLARVNALKPSIYKWKLNGSNGEGFLAHELAEVVPAAVTGEKDAVNEDGSIKAQSIDMSRVVPILVAAIQELAAEVNALKNA